MAQVPRARLTAETAPDAPAWWKEKVLPAVQAALGDSSAALDAALTLSQNVACAVNAVRIAMPSADEGFATARARCSTAQAIPNTGWNIINFDTVAFDSRSAITTGASWKFTAPESGVYLVSSMVVLDTIAAAGQAAHTVYVNGAALIRLGGFPATTLADHLSGSALVELTEGDTLDIRVAQTSATGNRSLPAADSTLNHVSILQVSSTQRAAPSCFPVTFKAAIQGKGFKPSLVLVGNIRDANTGGAPALAGGVGTPIWDWNGKDSVSLLDLPGLLFGHSYEVTLVAFA